MANELEQRARTFLPAHWNNAMGDWTDEGRREYAEEYATEAVIAALQQAQQPGGQAVAVVGDDLYPAWVDDAPDLPPGTKLYLAAPALPEVSATQVADAVVAAEKSLHGSLAAGMPVHPVCVRAALESYRASLLGEVTS